MVENLCSRARHLTRWIALHNMTVTDTYITCWRAKYDQPFWRPITAIREADTDGNPATTSIPTGRRSSTPRRTPIGPAATAA
jgi:hypothetical protein